MSGQVNNVASDDVRLAWYLVCFGAILVVLLIVVVPLAAAPGAPDIRTVSTAISLTSGAALLAALVMGGMLVRRVQANRSADGELDAIERLYSSDAIRNRLTSLTARYRSVPSVQRQIEARRQSIESRLQLVVGLERRAALSARFESMRAHATARAEQLYQATAVAQAYRTLQAAIVKQKSIREQGEADWTDRHKRMSWWDRLTKDGPDFEAMDRALVEMEKAKGKLEASGDLHRTRMHFRNLSDRAVARLAESEKMAIETVPETDQDWFPDANIAKSALLLSAMSIPVSVWADVARAHDIYDALRRVSSGHAAMSDVDIWLDSLFQPSESLAGLVSLTKGAYFEQLVADQTGGELFEHFNHPGTDIVIDNVAYQIKATDSATYINSIPDGIPVIATTEVTDLPDVESIGIADADLQSDTGLALGGTVVDVADTTADAVLTGLGGLGLIATIRGIGHAARSINGGDDAFVAVLEGASVAVAGTARSAINTMELAYKAGRFVGRPILRLAKHVAGSSGSK